LSGAEEKEAWSGKITGTTGEKMFGIPFGTGIHV
jgi:hypothetical protein